MRLAGLTVGLVVALTAPTIARALAEFFGQPRSGLFTDYVGGAIPSLVALPFLRLVAYRKRDVLLIFFVPLASIWLLALIGWRMPVIRHPDWPLRPNTSNMPKGSEGRSAADAGMDAPTGP